MAWSTLSEDGTLAFIIEAASETSGPFSEIGLAPSRGPGYPYLFVEKVAGEEAPRWYRIVELTGSGRGDSTPSFEATCIGGDDAGRVREVIRNRGDGVRRR